MPKHKLYKNVWLKDRLDCSLNHEVANKPYLANVCDEIIVYLFKLQIFLLP